MTAEILDPRLAQADYVRRFVQRVLGNDAPLHTLDRLSETDARLLCQAIQAVEQPQLPGLCKIHE